KYIMRRNSKLSKDDLSDALELASQHIPQGQQKILKDIIQLGDTDVKEIMQPRIDIVAFNREMKFSELLPKAVDSAFSRIPVYNLIPDNIIGILYTKDLLKHNDKFDEEKLVFSKLDDYNYVFEGKVTLGDFCRTVGMDEILLQSHKGGADT